MCYIFVGVKSTGSFLLGVKNRGLGSEAAKTTLSIICSYIAEMYAAYFFAEFDVVEVQTAEASLVSPFR